MNVALFGVGRSGTTAIYGLLQKILAQQLGDTVDYVYEPLLWDRFIFNKEFAKIKSEFDYINSFSVDGIYFNKKVPLFADKETWEKIPEDAKLYFRSLFRPDTKSHCLTKTIRCNGRIEFINHLCGDLKNIFIIRNPIDVVNSSLYQFSFFGDEYYPSDYPRFVNEIGDSSASYFPPVTCKEERIERELDYWLYMNLHAVEAVKSMGVNVNVICYENFKKDKKQVISDLCGFLDMPMHDDYFQSSRKVLGRSLGEVNITRSEFEIACSYLPRYFEMLSTLGIEPLFTEEDIVNKYKNFPKKPSFTRYFYGMKSTTIIGAFPRSSLYLRYILHRLQKLL